MRKLPILYLLLFTLPCLSSAQIIQTPAGPDPSVDYGRLARIDTFIEGYVRRGWINGVVTLVVHNGRVVQYKGYGYADIGQRRPMHRDDLFRIASQTKAITSVAVMMLWEEGKFGLDDPVSMYIPSFAHQGVLASFNWKDTTYTTVPAKRPITIRDLITHTSGLGYPAIGTPEANAIYAKDAMTGGVGVKQQTLADAMNRLGKLPLMFQPGEKWMYGLGHDVLGYLVQIWSGMSLEEFFSKRIFRPLGMNDTYFNVPASKGSRLVNFFMEDSSGIHRQDKTFGGALDMNFPLQHTDYFSGGGGLSSTISDYAIFLQMLLNGGEYNGVRLLSRNTVRMMTTNQIGDLFINIGGEEYKWGLGVSIESEKGSRLMPSQAGSYGWGGVFSTVYWVDPKEDMIVLLYMQMWGPHVADAQKQFKPLVYQAIDD